MREYYIMDSTKLSKLSALWKKVVPITSSFSNVPDNSYIVELKEMKLEESKKGRLQVVLSLEIVDGDFEGKILKRFDGVEEETGMGYFKNICEVIGWDVPEDMELWQESMDEFVANNTSLLDVAKVTTTNEKGTFSNVFINGISELTKVVEGEEGVEEVVEEVDGEVVEVGEEEVLEEVAEEEQQVVAPVRKMLAKPVAAKPIAAKPVAIRPVAVAAKPIAARPQTAQPERRPVPIKR
jgi:hypothetical protein